MSRDISYFLDILIMARDARDFIKDIDKEIFLSDKKCQYAVIRCLEVIGEAVKRLSEEARKTYPDVPWSSMAKMRDLLIHAYARVDLDEVWDTVEHDMPPLISVLEGIVPPEEKP